MVCKDKMSSTILPMGICELITCTCIHMICLRKGKFFNFHLLIYLNAGASQARAYMHKQVVEWGGTIFHKENFQEIFRGGENFSFPLFSEF